MIVKSSANQKIEINICVCLCVATKTITIKEEVYNKLVKLKAETESFSDLLTRLADNSSPTQLLEQMLGTFDLGDSSEIINEIRTRRKNWK